MGKHRKKVQIIILLAVLLLGGYTIGRTFFTNEDGLVEVGSKPPQFALVDLKGQVHQLQDYKGQALVLNFWGSFCPPCVTETPEFQRQYTKWTEAGEKLAIVGINLGEDQLTVSNFKQEYGLTYDILLDKDRKLMEHYGVKSFPTTFFVYPDGTIMDVFVGGMTQQQIDERITKLLK